LVNDREVLRIDTCSGKIFSIVVKWERILPSPLLSIMPYVVGFTVTVITMVLSTPVEAKIVAESTSVNAPDRGSDEV
jgi:hypothetical protein